MIEQKLSKLYENDDKCLDLTNKIIEVEKRMKNESKTNEIMISDLEKQLRK